MLVVAMLLCPSGHELIPHVIEIKPAAWHPVLAETSDACRWRKLARSSALITQGAPAQACRPLTSLRRNIRSAVMLQRPISLALPLQR